MEDVSISKFRAQVVRAGSTPASPGFVVSEGQNPVDPSGSGQNHLPVTIGSPANGLAVTDAQILTIDKAQIFAGTSSQFVKGDGTLDSTVYGTGSVTSVALTMPTAFTVAGSPITTTGTLAVTATGTTAQYIRGDGSLATFPGLTGFVPYTGATADVNLGTHDLLAERGTFANNGSSDTLTVNHTSGSGYGIIVTKGGSNEALYVSKTSGSGNAMTVVGGRTSLVDLALSSVTNTAGDFLTLSGGVVHKRTAAQVLTDIGGQAALTNPVTGTGTSNTLAKFTGSTSIGNSLFTDNGTNAGYNNAGVAARTFIIQATSGRPLALEVIENSNVHAIYLYPNNGGFNRISSDYMSGGVFLPLSLTSRENNADLVLQTSGNVTIGTTTDAGYKLDVNGTGRFSSQVDSSIFNSTSNAFRFSGNNALSLVTLSGQNVVKINAAGYWGSQIVGQNDQGLLINNTGAATFSNVVNANSSGQLKLESNNETSNFAYSNFLNTSGFLRWGVENSTGGGLFSGTSAYSSVIGSVTNTNFHIATNGAARVTIVNNGNVLIGTTTDSGFKLDVNGTGRFSGSLRSTTGDIRSINTGSNTPVSGPFYLLGDTTGTNFFLNQLNASNGLDWFYYNGTFSSSLFRLNSTGAATFSSSVTAATGGGGGGHVVTYGNVAPALNATGTLASNVSYGIIAIYETVNTGNGCILLMAAGVLTIVSNPSGVFTTTVDTASKWNVTVSSGVISIQNKRANGDSFQATINRLV
jgi:hypothetical protein